MIEPEPVESVMNKSPVGPTAIAEADTVVIAAVEPSAGAGASLEAAPPKTSAMLPSVPTRLTVAPVRMYTDPSEVAATADGDSATLVAGQLLHGLPLVIAGTPANTVRLPAVSVRRTCLRPASAL